MLKTITNLKEIKNKKEVIKKIFSLKDFIDNKNIDNTSYLFDKNWIIDNDYIAIPSFPNMFDFFDITSIDEINNKTYNIYPLIPEIKIIEDYDYKKIAPFDYFVMLKYYYITNFYNLSKLYFESPGFFLIFDNSFEFNILFNSDLGYQVTLAKANLINKIFEDNFINIFLEFENDISTDREKILYSSMFKYYKSILQKQGYLPKGDK